jgi:Flp pilus assembly protein TadG
MTLREAFVMRFSELLSIPGSLARRFHHGQRGAVLLIVAGGILMLCGFAGLAIDVGRMMVTRGDLQNAADAMALAGAQDLPDTTVANTKAREWGPKNDIVNSEIVSVTFGVTCSGVSRPDTITVRLSRTENTFFMAVLDVDSTTVTACATAEQYNGDGYAIFAHEPECNSDNLDAFDKAGSDIDVDGDIHSNSYMTISGSNNRVTGHAGYQCGQDISGSNNTFASGPSNDGYRDWPFYFTWDDLDDYCTPELSRFDGSKLDITSSHPQYWTNDDPSTKELKSGVYCSTGDLVLSDSQITGNVTFIALKKLEISGSEFDLTSYLGLDGTELLAVSFSTDSSNCLNMSGSGGELWGAIFAPFCRIKVEGSSNQSLMGQVVADEVYLSGSGWQLTYDGGDSGRRARLIE